MGRASSGDSSTLYKGYRVGLSPVIVSEQSQEPNEGGTTRVWEVSQVERSAGAKTLRWR